MHLFERALPFEKMSAQTIIKSKTFFMPNTDIPMAEKVSKFDTPDMCIYFEMIPVLPKRQPSKWARYQRDN